MISLTRTELRWIMMWLRELETIHAEDASHPLVKLDMENSKIVREKIELVLERGQKRIEIK